MKLQRATATSAVVLMMTGASMLSFAVPLHDDVADLARTCKHRYVSDDDMPAHVHLEDHHRLVKRSLENQLRIKVFFHESVEKLNAQKRNVVKSKVVPEAVRYWETVLKVRRNFATIRLHRKCKNNQYFLEKGNPIQFCKETCVQTKCGEFIVPDDHLGSCHTCDSNGRDCKMVTESGEGIDGVDFVLYVSALPTQQCGESIGGEASTIAYAAHCQQEAAFDRPIAGHTNICPAAIGDSRREEEALTSTLKHELLHALGFSSSLFAFFRDAEGNPRTPRGADGKPSIDKRLQVRKWSEDTVKTVQREWSVRSGNVTRTFHVMVTPRVQEEVRKHFGCDSLEGAELEDQGGDGTALTHWEKRLFQNEAMTGTVHTQNPAYSRLTFALLEDSGWYFPNYDMAEEIHWGKGLGCDFALRSCKDWMATMDGPYCSELMQSSPKTSCTDDARSVGSCNLVKFSSDLPKQYQNFDSMEGVDEGDVAKIGSSVTLADFCPYVQEFTWTSSSDRAARGTRCTDPLNKPSETNNYALEDYGREARCFQQGSKWEQRSCTTLKQWKHFGAGCYSYKCEDGMLNIVVRNVSLTCEEPGQKVEVRLRQGNWLHEGSVVCPKCEEYCDHCEKGKKARTDPSAYLEDLDDTCFQGSSNTLSDFLKAFTIKLG